MTRRVTIRTHEIGQRFATGATLRDARTGRVVARTETPRPYGYTGAALQDAASLAQDRGWTVVDDDMID